MGSSFMQQFMAGWQMGQGRNENRRRDQELMLEQQRQEQMLAQRAQEFELQKEEFAARKKRLAAEEAELQFKAKRDAASMMSRNEQTLPPETQDLGGGTTLNLGPAVQPRAPITAAIPYAPEGTPEVPLPFREDIEEQQQAERQQKMRELLGLERGKLAVKQEFEPAPEDNPAAWKQQGDGTYVNVLSGAVRGRPDPTKVGGGISGGGAIGGPVAPPVEAGGGIPTFGTAKSEAERKAVELAWGSVGEMPSFVAFVRDNSDIFGPAAGRATKLKQSGIGEFLGMDSPRFDVAEKQAEFAIMRNNMVNALSGAAVSPAEFERLKEQIPELTDPPTVVAAKLKVLDKYFSRKLHGFGVPLPGRNEIDWSPFGGGGKTAAPTAPRSGPAKPGVTINGVLVEEE